MPSAALQMTPRWEEHQRLCCHPDGHRKAGEMGWQQPPAGPCLRGGTATGTDWGAAWQKRLWESWSLGNCFILSFAFLMSKVSCETCLGTAEQCTCHRFFALLQHFQAQEMFASMTGQL